MQAVLVRIEEPKTAWCHALSERFPRLDIEVLSITSQPGRNCTETAILQGNQLDEALEFLDRHPHVQGAKLIGRSAGSAQVRLHLGACPVADLIPLTGIAPRLPFRARAGQDVWFLIGPDPAVEAAKEHLRADGIPIRAVHRAAWAGVEARLTENQRRVLRAAVDHGYYDYPRKITLSSLAERIGVAKSTLSEALMVIEKKVMGQYSDETSIVEQDEEPPSAERRDLEPSTINGT